MACVPNLYYTDYNPWHGHYTQKNNFSCILHTSTSLRSLSVRVCIGPSPFLPLSHTLAHTYTHTHTFTLSLARSLPKPLECSCSLEHIVCLTHSSASSLFDALICVAAHIYGSLSLLLCFSLFLARFLLVVSVSNWSIFLA